MCFSNHDGSLLKRQLGAVHGLAFRENGTTAHLKKYVLYHSAEHCLGTSVTELKQTYVRYFIHCAQPKGCDLLLCM